MQSPAAVLPGLTKAIGGIYQAMHAGGAPAELLELVHLRASQINGCTYCAHAGASNLRKAGESDERLWTIAAWRDAPYFTDAERAALALTEAVTRIADKGTVPDDVWDDAADHFDEKSLAAIITMIATTNFFNRLNVTVRQPVGTSWS
ncbi:carboxymuconolactone decarboxylase family protein [Pseudonocardia humida]